jgi:hypothetical protein
MMSLRWRWRQMQLSFLASYWWADAELQRPIAQSAGR